MKTPSLILGAGLIFWGWQTGLWIFAVPMAVILEAARFFPSRWDLSTADFRRIGNFCLIILIFLNVYLLIQNPTFYFIYTLLQWLPVVLFPLLAAQTYSVNENIDVTRLFLLFNEGVEHQNKRFTININYLYLAACILSASNANIGNISFYSGMFLLVAIVLWLHRYKRFSPLVWLCLILTAGTVGFIGQIGLHQLHLTFEDHVATWYSNANEQETNSLKKQTNIGDIGLLKQSNEIVLRVASQGENISDLLLREATYNKYRSSIWLASKPDFMPVQSDKNRATWYLGNKPANNSKITISATLRGGKGLLTLPDGTFQIDELPVERMEKNKYGAVKVAGKVDDIAYKIQFYNKVSLDNLPTAEDLEIPNKERPALNQIISQLDIQGKSQPEILNRVERFFRKNFTYSLKLVGKDNETTPLSTFLLKTRAGHCEYFASATTLLLRAAGIPARYVVGYSVHEFSRLENQYIVRSRHAHAWTIVYFNDRWQAFDTTPADWTSIEDANASKLGFIFDLWSLLGFKVSGWLRYVFGSNGLKYWWWLILPLILILIWRFAPKKGVRRLSVKKILPKQFAKSNQTKREAEFYLIEKALNELGFVRQPSESLKNWIERLKEEFPASDLIEELRLVIELHYRDRFDPKGIKENERAILHSSIQSWLDKYLIFSQSWRNK